MTQKPLALLLTILTLSACSSPADLTFENARVRALIPGQDKTAAYLEVHNGTSVPVILVGAGADGVRAIEIHTTRMEDGVMRMRRLEEVAIPPGETVRFQPGGRHLMLFGVTSLGPQLDVQLRFADGSSRRVRFEQIAIQAQ